MSKLDGLIQCYRNIATENLTGEELTGAFDTADEAAAELEALQAENAELYRLQKVMQNEITHLHRELSGLRAVVEAARLLFEQYELSGSYHYEGDVPGWDECFGYPLERDKALGQLAAALERVQKAEER